ncbi:hypothetical protein KUCAC02_009938, partial [Chaenocephalus aceratus]
VNTSTVWCPQQVNPPVKGLPQSTRPPYSGGLLLLAEARQQRSGMLLFLPL